MTDEQMDARLRSAGEVWRATNTPVVEPETSPVGALTIPPANSSRRKRTGLLASAALVVAALVAGGTLLVVSLGSNTNHRSPVEAGPTGLVSTPWELVAITDANGQGVPVAGNAGLAIGPDDFVKGNDGCNGMGGKVNISGSTIDFGNGLATTEMACLDDDVMATARHVDAMLSGTVTWTIDNDRLTLTKAGTGTLVYRAQPAPATSNDPHDLVGITWKLITIEQGTGPDGVAHSVTGNPTLRIDQVGAATLKFTDGCNSDTATAKVGAGTISILTTGGTLAYCRQSNEVLAILKGEITWQIKAGQLTITKEGVGALIYTPSGNRSQVVGPAWTLTTLKVHGASVPLADAPFTLVFASDGTFKLTTPCHGYLGKAKFDSDIVTLSGIHDLGGADCRESTIQQLVGFLDGAVRWSVDNGRLDLAKGDIATVFDSRSSAFQQLANRTWTLATWDTSDPNAPTLPSGTYRTTSKIRFDGAGHVTITHRCYVNKGVAVITQDAIDIKGVTLDSALPCPATSTQQAEQDDNAFIDSVLTGHLPWALNGGYLVLTKGSTTLSFSG